MRDTIKDYNALGTAYSASRRADPDIEALIHSQLGAARFVLNVGAGTGNYEPADRHVVALEPSVQQRAQRPTHLPPALIGTAQSIPFDDNSFDAAMAILTVHHWPDPAAGLREVRRVTQGAVVIMAFDPAGETEFWLKDYLPEMAALERTRDTDFGLMKRVVGGRCAVIDVPVRRECTDWFQSALYARPEELLKPEVRAAQSMWRFLDEGLVARFVAALSADLESGQWDDRYGHYRTKPSIKTQLRLIVSHPAD
mgnify:CR=1 FL=1